MHVFLSVCLSHSLSRSLSLSLPLSPSLSLFSLPISVTILFVSLFFSFLFFSFLWFVLFFRPFCFVCSSFSFSHSLSVLGKLELKTRNQKKQDKIKNAIEIEGVANPV